MKKLFTLKHYYRYNRYRVVAFSVFLILTGIYSVNINGQIKVAPGAAAKSVDITEKPDKLNSSDSIDRNISDILKPDEVKSKPDDQAVNTLPEIRRPSDKSVQDQKENTLTVITLSDSEIEKMKADINAFREKAPEILPDNLNVISIPDRDISNAKADGPELKTDNQVINALPKIREAAKSIRQEEIKSTLPEMPLHNF